MRRSILSLLVIPVLVTVTCWSGFPIPGPGQDPLTIIDISQKQIRLINQYANADSARRNKIFSDSLYIPYRAFWDGYMGGEKNLIRWLNSDVIPAYTKRNDSINGRVLVTDLNSVNSNMKKLTGYEARGTWYIAYGPGWTDLGGLGSIGMLIDLSHGNNRSNARILKMFPHELTHQIYGTENSHRDTTTLGAILGEGFAVYMNQLYWGNKYTAAENLGYTEAEFQACITYEAEVRKFFEENKFSTDKAVIDKFRNRSFHLRKELPGAIGYYTGFQIVRQYVNKYGKDKWKDVFVKSPKEIYKASSY